jgi:hypothetical protein
MENSTGLKREQHHIRHQKSMAYNAIITGF